MLEAPGRGGGGILIGLAVIVIGIAAVLLLMKPLSQDATDRAHAASQAAQAQASAQTAAERERTERERLAQETQQQAAVLRAEADARTINVLSIIGAVGGVALLGLVILGCVMFGTNWADNRQLQRTLLLLEAQREARLALQPPAPEDAVVLLAAPRRRNVNVEER